MGTGPEVSFQRGSKPGSLRVIGRQRLADVYILPSNSPYPVRVQFVLADGTNAGGSIQLVGRGNGLAAPLSVIGGLFNEYKVNKFCYEYVTRKGTNNDLGMTWGFAEDPAWPYTHNIQFFDDSITAVRQFYPTEGNLSTLSNAWQFPVWQPQACLDVTKSLPKTFKYVTGWTSDPDATACQFYGGTPAADLRNFCSGVLLAACDGDNLVSTILRIGTLFYNYDYEYHDISFGAIQGTRFERNTPSLDQKTQDGKETDKAFVLPGVSREMLGLPPKLRSLSLIHI